MLLIITYSNTKRFLKTTIHNLKSYFSGGYQRLPKTPPCNPFSCTGTGLHTSRFNHSYREPISTTNIKETSNMMVKEPNLINNHYEVDHNIKQQEENMKVDYVNIDKDEGSSLSKCLVTKKLKELEMMDKNNVDLVLDIEEVRYYYSRLTCPVYRDIVEKFFVDMYSGTFVLSRVENSVSKNLLI